MTRSQGRGTPLKIQLSLVVVYIYAEKIEKLFMQVKEQNTN